jgi:acyl dehydratase
VIPAQRSRDLVVGSEIAGPRRRMTMERIRWYDDAMLSAAKGEFTRAGSNIHTDEEYARSQGLPARIADGMISTNWMSEMLVEQFGMDYLERGELRTKFVKPIFLGAVVSVRARVRSFERSADGGAVYVLDVWCEDEKGVKLTDGDARVEVAPAR